MSSAPAIALLVPDTAVVSVSSIALKSSVPATVTSWLGLPEADSSTARRASAAAGAGAICAKGAG